MRTKKIEVRISPELLEEIDQAAANAWQSRSDWIRESLVLRLNRQDIVARPDPEKLWQAELARLSKPPQGPP